MADGSISWILVGIVSVSVFGASEGCWRPSNGYEHTNRYITTPDQYKCLKDTPKLPGNVAVFVHATAHPNPLGEVVHFVTSNAAEIRFVDVHGNMIAIIPKYQHALGVFQFGGNRLLHMPATYKSFDVRFDAPATDTPADIDTILTWRSAEKLRIAGNDATLRLMQRADELRQIETLQELSLDIQKKGYKEMNLFPFLHQMHGLRKIEFVADAAMTENEVMAFALHQNVSRVNFDTKVLPDRIVYVSVYRPEESLD